MEISQTLAGDKKSSLIQIAPVMLCFFAMGFVDWLAPHQTMCRKMRA